MLIKILQVVNSQYYNDDYYQDTYWPQLITTDWENISEEEYDRLLRWVHRQNNKSTTNVKYVILINNPDLTAPKCLADYKKILDNEEKAAKIRKDEIERKKELRKKKLESKRAKEELELLRKLQEKYNVGK